jgi:hypothetical protein
MVEKKSLYIKGTFFANKVLLVLIIMLFFGLVLIG